LATLSSRAVWIARAIPSKAFAIADTPLRVKAPKDGRHRQAPTALENISPGVGRRRPRASYGQARRQGGNRHGPAPDRLARGMAPRPHTPAAHREAAHPRL